MTYAQALKSALLDQLGPTWLTFFPKWDVQRKGPWQGKAGAKPVALLLHHTASAATSSTNPAAAGNQWGANASVINYIQNHPYGVPAANFTLDRDGRVYVHASMPINHAGLGSFKGKAPWSVLGVPADRGNDWMLGVEIMDKGLSATSITEAQKDSLVFLLRACRHASGWATIGELHRPQHRDWTQRKIDLRVSNAEVGRWITRYGFAA